MRVPVVEEAGELRLEHVDLLAGGIRSLAARARGVGEHAVDEHHGRRQRERPGLEVARLDRRARCRHLLRDRDLTDEEGVLPRAALRRRELGNQTLLVRCKRERSRPDLNATMLHHLNLCAVLWAMHLSSSLQRRNEPSPTFAIVRRDAGLARILRPELNVCVWRRTLPRRLGPWLNLLGRTLVHAVTARISPDLASTQRLFTGLPERAEMHAWAADVATLASLFCKLLGTKSLRASVATVDTNKCRKFHTDYKSLRLVCTYAGPGTEWVDDRHADRSAMRHEDACIDTANTRIVRRGSSIERAKPGDVVLLKGELFAGNAGRAAVHRSPPIESTGDRRIVLTFDER